MSVLVELNKFPRHIIDEYIQILEKEGYEPLPSPAVPNMEYVGTFKLVPYQYNITDEVDNAWKLFCYKHRIATLKHLEKLIEHKEAYHILRLNDLESYGKCDITTPDEGVSNFIHFGVMILFLICLLFYIYG